VVLVWQSTRKFRRATWLAAVGLTVFLGVAGLFLSGSKSGWLIALAIGVFWLCRLKWPRRMKWMVVLALVAGGLIIFALRFQTYFAKGATSVGARFDYWHAAAHVTAEHPAFGSGPGTFQRPYAVLKRPDAEMARLVHNDYLEQFSDSGLVGGISYAAWIGLLLWTLGRRVWTAGDWLPFAIFTGLLGWFIQGFIEFSLFVPALAWTAFTLSGCLLSWTANQVDKSRTAV
jgi:O-antigen ligase